jgi:hypothetical protein
MILSLSQAVATYSLSFCLKERILFLFCKNLTGGYYFLIKASLRLSHELILPLGNESSQPLALPLRENGNNFTLTVAFLKFCISQISQKS